MKEEEYKLSFEYNEPEIIISEELLEKEKEYLKMDRELYMECLNNKPLCERVTRQEKRDGLILYWHVYKVCSANT